MNTQYKISQEYMQFTKFNVLVLFKNTEIVVKGAWSEIFGKLIFFKLAEYGHFSYQNIIHGEKIANMYLICKQFEKTNNAYVTYCFINGGNHVF